MKPYPDFKKAMRQRESSGNYQCVNKFGFLGAYQFGMARLCDLGITERIDPKSTGTARSLFRFKPPYSLEVFLGSPDLQDKTFDLHVQLLKRLCVKLAPENLSGAIAACHLLGVGGLTHFVRQRIDECDALGTKLSDYYEEFRGYEIP